MFNITNPLVFKNFKDEAIRNIEVDYITFALILDHNLRFITHPSGLHYNKHLALMCNDATIIVRVTKETQIRERKTSIYEFELSTI